MADVIINVGCHYGDHHWYDFTILHAKYAGASAVSRSNAGSGYQLITTTSYMKHGTLHHSSSLLDQAGTGSVGPCNIKLLNQSDPFLLSIILTLNSNRKQINKNTWSLQYTTKKVYDNENAKKHYKNWLSYAQKVLKDITSQMW